MRPPPTAPTRTASAGHQGPCVRRGAPAARALLFTFLVLGPGAAEAELPAGGTREDTGSGRHPSGLVPAGAPREDTGSGRPPSGFVSPGAPPPDAVRAPPPEAGSSTADGVERRAEELERLAAEIQALRELLAGRLPALPIAALCDVELSDDAAVAEYLLRLEAPPEPPAPAAGRGGASGAVPASGPAPGSSTPEGRPSGGAGTGAGGGGAEAGALSLAAERDRLRLAFLRRPGPERAALLAAERERNRLEAEREAAQRAAVAAERAEREAAEARRTAMEEVERARSGAAKGLAEERARAEAAGGALASLQVELAASQQAEADQARRRFERGQRLHERSSAPDRDGDADRLFDDADAALDQGRQELASALDGLRAPLRATRFRPALEPGSVEDPALEPDRSALHLVIDRVNARADELAIAERQQRVDRAAALAEDVRRLNLLRLELLPRLSEAKRERVMGLQREGISQAVRELRHLALMARWYPGARLRELAGLRARLNDVATMGAVGLTAIELLLLCVAALVVRRKQRGWIASARNLLLPRIPAGGARIFSGRWIGHLAAVSGELLLLAFVWLLFDWLRGPDEPIELELLEAVVLAYAWYRLLFGVSYRFITAAASIRRAELRQPVKLRVLRSIRVVGGYVLWVWVFLLVSAAVLGRGYLHTLVVEFAWLGGAPIALGLLSSWRGEIAASYLRTHPLGPLARLVERTRGRQVGLLAAALALGHVTTRGVALYLKHAALGFDQTRKALAYLFRRQLERRADTVGRASSDVGALPASVRAAFDAVPAPPELRISRFPQLEELAAQAAALAAGGSGDTVVLVGEAGSGRTTWLDELERRVGAVPVVRHAIAGRVLEPAELCRALAGALDLPEAHDARTLADAVAAGPPRVVLLDDCQHVVLRAVGGTSALDALTELTGRTAGHVLWVCAFTGFTFDHLTSLHPGQVLFRRVVRLDGWSEEHVGELIEQRMRASGVEVTYEDLVVEHIDGTEFEHEVIRTAERYHRLLWDYADGNPRVVLHYWLRSLVPDAEGRLRVRLFAAPAADALEGLAEQPRFLLACVVLHGTLSASEAARALRFPATACELGLANLRSAGYLTEERGRYRASTRWHRAILRYLQRKHLIFT